MKLIALFVALASCNMLQAQNVGIGTNNPQQRLHVAGNVRVDGMAGGNGLIMHNSTGDLSTLGLGTDTNQVLLSTGVWGRLNGTVPSGSLVASLDDNNANLLQRGFRLFGFLPGVTVFNTSPIFAPANTWGSTYVEGVPGKYAPPRFDANNIFFWVDTVMYAFAENNFYIYNPLTDVWRFGFANPTAFRTSAGCKMVYTGTELIVWGGIYSSATNNGFRYNPTTNVWTAIPTAGQPSARSQFGMQLVNNRLVVWGGATAGGAVLGDGAVLNLATNTWSSITATGAPSARREFYSVVNTIQNTMIVWAGYNMATQNMVGDGSSYNPVTNTWTPITNTNAPIPRSGASAVWSGTEMIIFGGHGQAVADRYLNTGARYNPAFNVWTATSTTGAPRVERQGAIWTGSRMLISGGSSNIFDIVGTPWTQNAYNYDPATDSWTSANFMTIGKVSHVLLMADDMVLAFGGGTTIFNSVTQDYAFAGSTIHGCRYFMTNTSTSQTLQGSAPRLYLYMKE